MPTLEVQLTKAQKDLAALEEVMKTGSRWYCPRKRADQQHGNDAELRGLRERVGYLQQRLYNKARNQANQPPQQVLVPTEPEPQHTEQQGTNVEPDGQLVPSESPVDVVQTQ